MTTDRREGDRSARQRPGSEAELRQGTWRSSAAEAGQGTWRSDAAETGQGTRRSSAAEAGPGVRKRSGSASELRQGTRRSSAAETGQGTRRSRTSEPEQAAREEKDAQRQRSRARDSRTARAKKQRQQEQLRRGYLDLLVRVVLLVAAGWILLTQVFLITQVSGNGMFPALKDGDLVFAYRLQREYAKNDVVVYEADGEERIGRIVARETDVVTLDDSGTLLVNGTAQSGEILYPTYAEGELEYPYTVPEEHVFVLGDYRTQTEDSRILGAIPVKDVKGKVITILRRRGL